MPPPRPMSKFLSTDTLSRMAVDKRQSVSLNADGTTIQKSDDLLLSYHTRIGNVKERTRCSCRSSVSTFTTAPLSSWERAWLGGRVDESWVSVNQKGIQLTPSFVSWHVEFYVILLQVWHVWRHSLFARLTRHQSFDIYLITTAVSLCCSYYYRSINASQQHVRCHLCSHCCP